mmetsp:Transcript_22301/g.32916  ORF Transcript_22301/g.32916 Transcript_22301/m.32916 type:complete len:551 (+) Transcript_22301:30-1682(+)|eukprot:CAMPEP_0194239122 /NCGR_PEP_ID=MMETSP0158-20130606/5681_1 /TAXON_ID=33649 /ORGANISM="Thalassionema nitzschioides, Strain L26-B" /LENGTH=550 /DNA_ID=CAMNT_0038973529 /DNA_START=13 /DNA_END=1665 /DNA_ORIENTATION=-
MSTLSKDITTMLGATLVGLVSAASTYYITNFIRDLKDHQKRLEANEIRLASKEKSLSAQKAHKEPSGTLIDDVVVDKVYLWEVEHLGHRFDAESTSLLNTMRTGGLNPRSSGIGVKMLSDPESRTEYNRLISSHECVLADLVRKPEDGKTHTRAYVRAGPRKVLHFDPATTNAAIVTCGGLCPGLNNVVREITKTLCQLYSIGGKVYGIRGGYRGFYDPELEPFVLTPELVEDIHHEGGTILGSSRGGFDLEKITKFLSDKKIKTLFVIGGDGTHRGAFAIHEGCMKKGLNVAVAGIPKTIDNDVDYIDHSFGFRSAVEAAQAAIRSAKTEAVCNLPNGIGIVKLMGRSAGFIAVHSTMASGDVDLCLVPEVPLVLDGEKGCLPFLRQRVKQQGYAVVVVAEGAGEEVVGTSTEKDASGNKKLPAIGEFLKEKVTEYFDSKGDVATVKYIDPSYMIRSVPANASDSMYCMQLGQNAVHGAMAGFTGFSVGLCNNRMVLLPIPDLVATSPRSMDPRGRTWERVLAVTRQPNTVRPLEPGETEVPHEGGIIR